MLIASITPMIFNDTSKLSQLRASDFFYPTESDAASLECILSRTYIQSKNIRKPLNVQKISALRFSLSVSKEET